MDSYKIEWKRAAEHDIRKINPKQIPKIIESIELLTNDPFPPQHIKLQNTKEIYRLRVGNYRVIYRVNTNTKTITIYHVRHRKDAYRRW